MEVVKTIQLSKKQKSMLNAAKKLAKESSFPSYRMGAIIVKSNRILGFGLNTNSPGVLKNRKYDKSRHGYFLGVHAELRAILNASGSDLRGSTIYIAGWTRVGNSICSRPCEKCYNELKNAGIKRAIYHDQNGEGIILEIR